MSLGLALLSSFQQLHPPVTLVDSGVMILKNGTIDSFHLITSPRSGLMVKQIKTACIGIILNLPVQVY